MIAGFDFLSKAVFRLFKPCLNCCVCSEAVAHSHYARLCCSVRVSLKRSPAHTMHHRAPAHTHPPTTDNTWTTSLARAANTGQPVDNIVGECRQHCWRASPTSLAISANGWPPSPMVGKHRQPLARMANDVGDTRQRCCPCVVRCWLPSPTMLSKCCPLLAGVCG